MYEHGRVQPTLVMALRLEIILRTPVAFLFPNLYERLRAEIRTQEETTESGQPNAFENNSSKLL